MSCLLFSYFRICFGFSFYSPLPACVQSKNGNFFCINMSFNPDDVDAENEKLKQENEKLKKQIDELSAKLAQHEIAARNAGSAGLAWAAGAAIGHDEYFGTRNSGNGGVGRRSIPFSRRNPKQHQGRMAYLLKKLEEKQSWTQDAIADLQSYFVARNVLGAGDEFFRAAVIAYAGENGREIITDIDLFLAMLQN
jgi:hypothetical protein